MEGVTPVGSEGSKAGESPPSDTSGRTGTEEERKVREAGQTRPGGQVVVFPSKTAGSSASYVPPPPSTPQQIAAGRRRFVIFSVGVGALPPLAPLFPRGRFPQSQ